MRRSVLALFLLSALAGCNDEALIQRSTATGPSGTVGGPSVQGRVIDATTTAAVAGATVALQGKTTTTAATGLFALQDLVAGPATLTISHPLYVTLEVAFEVQTSSSQIAEFRLTRR